MAAAAPAQQSRTGNIIIFFIGTAISAWVVHGQMVKPLERQQTGLEEELKILQERVQTGKNLAVKNANLKMEQDAVQPLFAAITAVFPDTSVDASKISGVLDGATKDLPASHVNILRAPPLKRGDVSWHAKTIQPEDVTAAYKNLVGDSKYKSLGDKAKIETGIKLGRFDQEWDIEAEWESFPAFLTKLSQLSFYFEVTQLDVYAVLDPAMRAGYRIPKTGLAKPPKRVKVRLVVSAVAFPPLPKAP